MPEPVKTQRVVLRVEQATDGSWVMKQCKDSWTTLPFRWPSRESAVHDMEVVVAALMKKGYEVVKPQEGGIPQ